MSRIAHGVAQATAASDVKVIIDINPDVRANASFADTVQPGDGRASERLKRYLSGFGIQYYAVSDINHSDDFTTVLGDYVASNLQEGERFLLVCDRVPGNLQEILGGLQPNFAGIYSK